MFFFSSSSSSCTAIIIWRWWSHWGLTSDEESTGRFEAGMCPEERGGTHGEGIGRDCGMRRFEVKIGYDHQTS